MNKLKIFIIMICVLGGYSALSADDKPKNKTDLWDSFKCEINRGVKLVELKEKLIESCNLDKPFSITSGNNAVDSNVSYTFCCHKK